MANKFIKVDYDKFENKRVTTIPSIEVIQVGNHYQDDWCYFKVNFRHVSTPNTDALLLDLFYRGKDWFFLRNGRLIININNVENLVLEPNESYSETGENTYGDITCDESDWYEINQEILKKLCDAKTIDFKIIGENKSVQASLNDFILYAQRFYNGLYDENAYLDSMNELLEEEKYLANANSNSNSGNGCIVTLLMAFTTISSFVVCLSFLVGLFA